MKTFVFTLYTLILFLGFSTLTMAQKEGGGIKVQLGGAVNYYLGPGNQSFDQFEENHLNWQLDGLVGIKLAESKDHKKTYLGVYGSAGSLNRTTITSMIQDQKFTIVNETEQNRYNLHYQWEVGFLIAEVLRVSTGSGTQYFGNQLLANSDGTSLQRDHFDYYSSTAGVQLKLGSVAWTINCNLLYGKDLDRTIVRPSTGLALTF
ncbi:hypothetical protein [Xanthocytophaga agilis]|uniref:Uncharacterized protein n=1 Tax=Xanthocytophaga agilis TaxID=3048010 RepID=A0AAE3R518_9BACT|nr:hypothetical protein [Xanthocytophaga agilis]MDJ1501490.1 hypothetical protein [Xanthocytophaga agilis]